MTRDQTYLLVEKMVGRERVEGASNNGRPDYRPISPALYTVLRTILGDKVPHVKDVKILRDTSGEGYLSDAATNQEAAKRVEALADLLGDMSDHLFDLLGYMESDEDMK